MSESSRKPTVVLLIEDNPGDARLVCEAMSEVGRGEFVVEVASDLHDGLIRLDTGGIDAIVSDLDLPDSEGLGAVARLRAHARGIPILVLTGSCDEARGIDALRFGVQDYLLKDEMVPRHLIRAIRYSLERKRLESMIADRNRELDAANRKLQAAQVDLERRVADRTEELALANRDLETLLHVAAHDLKEPLNAIAGYTRIIDEKHVERFDAKGRDLLRRIENCSGRMRQLLEGLLVLTRAQNIEVPGNISSMEDVVREALHRFEDKIRATGASIQVAKPLPSIRIHGTWAVEAVANLISNALKFPLPGRSPEIEIGAYEGPEGVGIAVRDRGPGVPPEMGERIFRLFQRGVGREVEGTGAGLAIVRQIAERHGGKAWVRTRDGGGSEFIATFSPARSERKSVELLLVDDEEDFVFIMRESLANCKLIRHLAVARDGVEALEYLQKKNGFRGVPTPDMVLLDINMPRKNGFEVLEAMRRDPELHRIPVAMVTSSVRKEDEVRSRDAGAAAYLTKPCRIDELLSVLNGLAA